MRKFIRNVIITLAILGLICAAFYKIGWLTSWREVISLYIIAFTSWVVPCSATWGVIGLMCGTFFGAGAILVIIALFAVALLHIMITSRIFGRKLLQENDRCGMIMELPPYHKPKWKNLFRFVGKRLGLV